MKRIFSMVMLTVVAICLSSCTTTDEKAASPAVTRATATATPSEDVEQTLVKLERDWAESLVKGDFAFTDRIVADDWTFRSWTGEIQTKAQVLEEFRSGVYKPEAIDLDNLKVRVFGDAAIATYGQTEKSKYRGQPSSGRYIFTDVWVKKNDKWQIVTTQGTKVEQPKGK